MRREIVAILAKIIARWNEKFQHIYPKACCGQKAKHYFLHFYGLHNVNFCFLKDACFLGPMFVLEEN